MEDNKKQLIKAALVLEGGAFRGIYTAGVLDYLLEQKLYLDTFYGVSAGALNGTNYLAGNYGRGALLILEHRKNKRYVGLPAYLESGSVVGFNFIFDDLNKEYPLYEQNLFSEDRNACVVTTNVYTGEPNYFDNHNDKETYYKAIRASASIPLVSKMVKINNQLHLDGGCSTKIPIRKALEDGQQKIIFVGTRENNYRRKKNNKEISLVKKMYHHYPKFIKAFTLANEKYNQDCDLIDKLVEEKKIYRITPSKPVKVKRLEKSIKKLSELYYLGYNDAKDHFDEMLDYLNQ